MIQMPLQDLHSFEYDSENETHKGWLGAHSKDEAVEEMRDNLEKLLEQRGKSFDEDKVSILFKE